MERARRRFPGALIAIWIALGGVPSCGGEAAPERPRHVVVVLIDTLRPDHLDLYGYERETAPFLASLAARSVTFRRAFSSSSWTAPSTASVFTGRYPPEHGVVAGFRAQRRDLNELEERGAADLELTPIAGSLATLPELLGRAGYRTLGTASNINIGAELGFDRGFERFERRHRAGADELLELVVGWRAELDPDEPTFTYLHLNDVHKPYVPREPWYEPKEDDTADAAARYDSEIRWLDDVLARMYVELGCAEDTLLVFVSDHGEEFGEHGQIGHEDTLYVQANRVLMMMHAPGRIAEGRWVEENVSLVDVLPTILELCDVGMPDGGSGRSLAGLVEVGREPEPADRTVFGHVDHRHDDREKWSVVHGEWKLILSHDGVELFDHRTDPGEARDLSESEGRVLDEMLDRLARFRAGLRVADGVDVSVEMDAELLEHLRELGYTDDGANE